METIHLASAKELNQQENYSPTVLSLLKCKCPRCRKGDMFAEKNPWNLKKTMKMNHECAVCGQTFDLEVGFYYGSGYISYALTVALSVATFVAWWVLFGFSIRDNRIFYWLGVNAFLLIALQPYLMRVSRTGWLAFFVRYDRNWKNNKPKAPERTNKDLENYW
ncbi:DUF983 domain-containing protein [Ferruginibacter sp. HRS2-29]|uniref:DUF983 domain-containing protein n=1 Tax=Ferruginibacter sp. HRS2-29 TaxID=2487334 RepID=UPI0020CDCE15|nr:DUF983 domain-containing protein [Ferruginibacter sp. HRS2-29]MCP9750788.1 DUF983 domain-containing protein [Ferruginibacter sp. HRS2-29]